VVGRGMDFLATADSRCVAVLAACRFRDKWRGCQELCRRRRRFRAPSAPANTILENGNGPHRNEYRSPGHLLRFIVSAAGLQTGFPRRACPTIARLNRSALELPVPAKYYPDLSASLPWV